MTIMTRPADAEPRAVVSAPMLVPAATPKPVIDKLSSALQETLKSDEVKKRFADLGATTYAPDKATPAALQQHLKSEMDKWGPLIKKAGVYAD